MRDRIRILLADDHPLLTAGLKMIIDEWPEFQVAGVAGDGAEAVQLCRSLRPDIVIMDMHMPKLSGAEAIARIRAFLPAVRILALTTFDDAETASDAMAAGCDGFLLKVIDHTKLRASLLSIADGIHVYDDCVITQMRENINGRPSIEFSQRELEILRLLCAGLTNGEIAARLGLRPGTAKNLVSMLLSKTNCISRAQMVRYASERELV